MGKMNLSDWKKFDQMGLGYGLIGSIVRNPAELAYKIKHKVARSEDEFAKMLAEAVKAEVENLVVDTFSDKFDLVDIFLYCDSRAGRYFGEALEELAIQSARKSTDIQSAIEIFKASALKRTAKELAELNIDEIKIELSAAEIENVTREFSKAA